MVKYITTPGSSLSSTSSCDTDSDVTDSDDEIRAVMNRLNKQTFNIVDENTVRRVSPEFWEFRLTPKVEREDMCLKGVMTKWKRDVLSVVKSKGAR